MIRERIAVVQCYIKHMKDIDINIRYPHTLRDKTLLNKAYEVAINHLII
jgi:hypothetical protein